MGVFPPSISVFSLIFSGINLFAGTSNGVYHSINNGTSWTIVNNGLTNTYVNCLTVSGSNIFAGTEGGVFLSVNNGTNWTLVNNGFASTTDILSLTVSGTNIFAGYHDGVFLSTNNGTLWTDVSNGLPTIYPLSTSVNSFAIQGTNIFVGSSRGVYMRPLSELTSVSNEVKVLPHEYTLFQNYPNPFNPSTVIKYAVPFESNINIRFYNSLGQIVREVNEGNRPVGNYEINFTSPGLASGIYFYSIKAISTDGKNDFIAVKKMILLK
jgi:Secretion system C-terminal sorting domain